MLGNHLEREQESLLKVYEIRVLSANNSENGRNNHPNILGTTDPS